MISGWFWIARIIAEDGPLKRLSLRVACAVTCLLAMSARASAEQDAIRPSVVKIFTTQRLPDYYRPWIKMDPSEVGGTGFVIDGKRILTNAHVVSYASQIYVQPYNSAEKFAAKVVVYSTAMDLAILSVEDETFFKGRPALVLDDRLPRAKAAVNVYGYPVGGNEMSVTEGITSRIEYTDYEYEVFGLRMQIDAAINPGNSGGPAVSDGKVLGVVFLLLSEAENIGYLIPIDEVKMFLADAEDGKYEGKPQLLVYFQPADNDALRASLGIAKDTGGCVITRVLGRDAGYPLKERDVITHIGPHAIDRSGNVRLGDDLQVLFTYYLAKLARGGVVPLTVIREGRTITVQAPVHARRHRLIPFLDGSYPDYFILGPIVFSTVTEDLAEHLRSDKEWNTFLVDLGSPIVTRATDPPQFDGEQLVVIPSPFFAHRLTKGFDFPAQRVVEQINGARVKSLSHLIELVRDSKDEFLEFTFAETGRGRVVFPRQQLLDATEEILTDNGIRRQAPPELETIWNKKP
jgi:S1-C subfamily serine protease